jgi:hypothetical protein
MRQLILTCTFIMTVFALNSQSLSKNTVVLNANIGAPHLFKGIVKIAANSDVFKENFDGTIEISDIKGYNPISVKGEYAFTKYFTLGLSSAFWNIKFNAYDYYNVQNVNQGSFLKDSVDTYSFKISSSSFGIRPNIHIPFKSSTNDLYVGLALGFTTNKLAIGFTSTDAGRLVKSFGKDLELDLSLPGGLYFAPTIGYRHYFGNFVGLNIEFGYEKGAIIQGGLAIRLNHKVNS